MCYIIMCVFRTIRKLKYLERTRSRKTNPPEMYSDALRKCTQYCEMQVKKKKQTLKLKLGLKGAFYKKLIHTKYRKITLPQFRLSQNFYQLYCLNT